MKQKQKIQKNQHKQTLVQFIIFHYYGQYIHSTIMTDTVIPSNSIFCGWQLSLWWGCFIIGKPSLAVSMVPLQSSCAGRLHEVVSSLAGIAQAVSMWYPWTHTQTKNSSSTILMSGVKGEQLRNTLHFHGESKAWYLVIWAEPKRGKKRHGKSHSTVC